MALSTFADLYGELQARTSIGVPLDTSRAKQLINDGLAELYDTASWYFLETSTTGNAPLTIDDVKQVLSVFDTSSLTELVSLPYREFLEFDPAQTKTGKPQWWALDGTTVRVWPLNTTDTISVRYIKVPTALSADSDTTLIPDRYLSIVVDLAQVRVMARDREGQAEAQALRAEIDREVGAMVQNLAMREYDFPRVQRVFNDSEYHIWPWRS